VRNKEREEEGLGMDETRLLLPSFPSFASLSAHKEGRKDGRKERGGTRLTRRRRRRELAKALD